MECTHVFTASADKLRKVEYQSPRMTLDVIVQLSRTHAQPCNIFNVKDIACSSMSLLALDSPKEDKARITWGSSESGNQETMDGCGDELTIQPTTATFCLLTVIACKSTLHVNILTSDTYEPKDDEQKSYLVIKIQSTARLTVWATYHWVSIPTRNCVPINTKCWDSS